jgi:D-alanyl-lipoteichoic acid acyltransferase DltB (MBOAT superfamily)
MLFNSVEYLVFLPTVAIGFFVLPVRVRWAWLLAASWYFYGSWSPRYLALFIANTGVAYVAGLLLGRSQNERVRRGIAFGAVGVLLGTLFIFKYLNFVVTSAVEVLHACGVQARFHPFDLALPVGVSFYTFQAIAYVVDVHQRHVAPERHPGVFALYKAFFAQLVAGPIERPERMLPQLNRPTRLEYDRIATGAALIVWGLFKKVVIADRLAIYVDEVYDHPGRYHGVPVIVATYLFAFQIYCDFSGYSDIAVGSARWFGYDLMQNFDRPYLARSTREFWGRWHISLSSWFRDYVYIPLGGNRVAPWRNQLNILIVFLLSGLWHGAAWTFAVWGALHGFYLLAGIWTAKWRAAVARLLRLDRVPRLHAWAQRFVVFQLVTFAWLFFRAKSFENAWTLLTSAGQLELAPGVINVHSMGHYELGVGLVAIVVLLVVHVWQDGANTADFLAKRPLVARWSIYYAMVAAILLFGEFNLTEFIYFQF